MAENEITRPTPLTAGKFALYQTPNGGVHLTLQVDGEPEPRHIEIPKLMLKMMMRKNGFNPADMTFDPAEIEG